VPCARGEATGIKLLINNNYILISYMSVFDEYDADLTSRNKWVPKHKIEMFSKTTFNNSD
jgi:hypothetical protein